MARQRNLYEILEAHELGLRQIKATLARISTTGISEHDALTGLGDDDHPQYHNDARGDARYSPLAHAHAHSSLTGVGASDHHARYTDAEAAAKIAADGLYMPKTGGTFTGDVSVTSGADLFTHKIHTGGTVWTQEPWSASTIELGDYGAIGTQGSYALDMAWNFDRGTDSGYYHKSVNSYSSAGLIRIDNDGITFCFDSSYGATSTPTQHLRMEPDGELNFIGVVDIQDDGTTRFGGDASYTNMYDPSGNKKLWIGSSSHYYNADNHYFRDVSSNQLVRIIDYSASTSVLQLRDGLTNVGNHETLRLNRGTGSTMQYVGYYSSYIHNPDTGEREKFKVLPLSMNHKYWKREWFMDLRPIKYDRRTEKLVDASTPPDFVQRELGFSIENLSKNTELLTTKGNQRGGSPDEYALLAVTVDYVQHLKCRLDKSDKRITELESQLAKCLQ